MSEPVVRRLILQRFRSLPAAALEFSNPTFLVGRNGSGKSNLADALAFLAEAMASPLSTVLHRRGGLAVIRNRGPGRGDRSDLGLGVVLGPLGGDTVGGRYAFAVRELPGAGFEVVREQCTVRLRGGEDRWFDRTGAEFRSNAGGLARALSDRSAEVRRQSALGLGYLGWTDGAPMLEAIARDDPSERVREAAAFAASLLVR